MDLSIIILNWNTKGFLTSCLDSICSNIKDDLKYEIIIVDNGSTDGSTEFIKSKYPQVILIENKVNLGTSQRNRGIEVSKGRYIAFLDSDIEMIEDKSFVKLINYLENNRSIGLIAPKLIHDDGSVQLSCKNFLSFYTPILRRLDFISLIKKTKLYKDQLMADWDHMTAREVDYAISAFWLFRKEVVDKAGMLDEKIFYAPEDVDYCLRVWKSGYKVLYYPDVKVKHHYQRITRKVFQKLTYEHIKGLVYYFWKHKYLIKPEIEGKTN